MSAQANIVLADGQATPVNRTFAPKGARSIQNKDVSVWRDQSPGIAAGYRSITEQHAPANSNGMEKFRFVIDVPTLEQAASGGSFVPPPTKAYATVGVIEVWAHVRASESELKDIAAFIKNLASSSYFTNAVINREPSW